MREFAPYLSGPGGFIMMIIIIIPRLLFEADHREDKEPEKDDHELNFIIYYF